MGRAELKARQIADKEGVSERRCCGPGLHRSTDRGAGAAAAAGKGSGSRVVRSLEGFGTDDRLCCGGGRPADPGVEMDHRQPPIFIRLRGKAASCRDGDFGLDDLPSSSAGNRRAGGMVCPCLSPRASDLDVDCAVRRCNPDWPHDFARSAVDSACRHARREHGIQAHGPFHVDGLHRWWPDGVGGTSGHWSDWRGHGLPYRHAANECPFSEGSVAPRSLVWFGQTFLEGRSLVLWNQLVAARLAAGQPAHGNQRHHPLRCAGISRTSDRLFAQQTRARTPCHGDFYLDRCGDPWHGWHHRRRRLRERQSLAW